jgi:hypothetical protein
MAAGAEVSEMGEDVLMVADAGEAEGADAADRTSRIAIPCSEGHAELLGVSMSTSWAADDLMHGTSRETNLVRKLLLLLL